MRNDPLNRVDSDGRQSEMLQRERDEEEAFRATLTPSQRQTYDAASARANRQLASGVRNAVIIGTAVRANPRGAVLGALGAGTAELATNENATVQSVFNAATGGAVGGAVADQRGSALAKGLIGGGAAPLGGEVTTFLNNLDNGGPLSTNMGESMTSPIAISGGVMGGIVGGFLEESGASPIVAGIAGEAASSSAQATEEDHE
ncbi:MAG TPA: hypothetical protein VEA80_04655 [Vitreimonas sp.]|nr:hypothetical protein [Vitreimonas sp.]